MRSYRRSRLTKRLERRTRKSLFFSLLGILAFLFILIKFGLPLLVNFSLFISNSKPTKDNLKKNTAAFIAAPILNPLPVATNSADIEISGISSPNQSVSLFINGSLVDKILTGKDGTFSFKQTLSPGENNIKVRAMVDNNDSDFSQSVLVAFKDTKPQLTVTSPSDGQSFSKEQNRVEVVGATDPQVKVTINGFWAITDETNKFSYTLPLQNGENVVKIIASDLAGNTTEKEIKVTYSP